MCGAAVARAGMSMQVMAAAPNAPATVLPRSDAAFIVNPLCFGLRSRGLPWAAVSAPYLTRGGDMEVENTVRGEHRESHYVMSANARSCLRMSFSTVRDAANNTKEAS